MSYSNCLCELKTGRNLCKCKRVKKEKKRKGWTKITVYTAVPTHKFVYHKMTSLTIYGKWVKKTLASITAGAYVAWNDDFQNTYYHDCLTLSYMMR